MINTLTADMDDMVFEDREKSYGAYYLRKRYPRHLMIGTLIVCLTGSLFGMAPVLARYFNLTEETSRNVPGIVIDINTMDPPPMIDEVNPPTPPPDLPPPPQVETVEFRIPDPTPESELDPDDDQMMADVETLRDAPYIGLENQEGTDEIFFDENMDLDERIPEVIVDHGPGINDFVSVEEEPQPVNMNDLIKLIGYPQIARDAGIQGTVVVRVLVDKKGRYSNHKVINQVHPILSKNVEKHINRLTFTPAIQGGNPIQFWVNIPFNFKLLDK